MPFPPFLSCKRKTPVTLFFSLLLSLFPPPLPSSSFSLCILKLSIADSALREERLRLQRLPYSAWAAIPLWITYATVGAEVCVCLCLDICKTCFYTLLCFCEPSFWGCFTLSIFTGRFCVVGVKKRFILN